MLKWRHEWEIHQLISPAYTVRWMRVLRNENHTIIPSVPSKNPSISEATYWLLVMGFKNLQWSIGVWHTNIDFSQDHNKLIHSEVVYLCKQNSAAINAEPWLDSLHWCNTEHQLLDRDGGGGWVTYAHWLPALQLIRESASCNTTATSQLWGKQIEPGWWCVYISTLQTLWTS